MTDFDTESKAYPRSQHQFDHLERFSLSSRTSMIPNSGGSGGTAAASIRRIAASNMKAEFADEMVSGRRTLTCTTQLDESRVRTRRWQLGIAAVYGGVDQCGGFVHRRRCKPSEQQRVVRRRLPVTKTEMTDAPVGRRVRRTLQQIRPS